MKSAQLGDTEMEALVSQITLKVESGGRDWLSLSGASVAMSMEAGCARLSSVSMGMLELVQGSKLVRSAERLELFVSGGEEVQSLQKVHG